MVRSIVFSVALLFLAHAEAGYAAEPVAEPPADPAEQLLLEAKKAYQIGSPERAIELGRKIESDHKTSPVYKEAMDFVAMATEKLKLIQETRALSDKSFRLMAEKDYEAALDINHQVIRVEIDKGDPRANRIIQFQNRAAKSISRCLESQEDFKGALRWYKLARDKYPYSSWCGTCNWGEAQLTASEVARLSFKAGEEGAFDKAEQMLIKGSSCEDLTFLIVDQYHQRGELPALEAKLEAARQERLAAARRAQAERGQQIDPNYDGHVPSSRTAHKYIAIVRMIEREDADGLWDLMTARYRKQDGSATSKRIRIEEWQLKRSHAALKEIPEKFVPLLRASLAELSEVQGFAAEMLAAMNVREAVPDIEAAIFAAERHAVATRENVRHRVGNLLRALQKLDENRYLRMLEQLATSEDQRVREIGSEYLESLQSKKDD